MDTEVFIADGKEAEACSWPLTYI